ncbi:aldose epimerase family protein [Salinimicrobium marinum]|nr:aldose epimerase family protein [Salinimicrobium marinum]
MQKEHYGTTPKGEAVDQYTMENENGLEVKIITFGGRITSLKAPDKNGDLKDIVLGFDSLSEYINENPYFGAIIGRFGNRIAGGKFSLDGRQYELARNNGENHLHGGKKGFDNVVWIAEENGHSQNSLKLSYLSKHMEEGYPGNLEVSVTYTLQQDNILEVNYEATTDQQTIINLTQHSYFNLSGNFSEEILDHEVQINADEFLPVNESLIPTGDFKKVDGSAFDFRKPKKVGLEIEAEDEQLKLAKGYDHCWIINNSQDGVRFAASAHDPNSGRLLEVYTTELGMQFYTGNSLDGSLSQKGGEGNFGKRSGFCFETQHFPDSPSQEKFPSVVLKPGEVFSSKTFFKFSVK